MFRNALALVALSVMLPACSANNAPGAPLPTAPSAVTSLAGTSWVLQRLGDVDVLATAQPTLSFADGGRVSGNSSCNQFSGTARIDGNSLTVGPLAVTRMACAERIMQQEQQYLEALGRTNRFEITGARLLLFAPGASEPLQFAGR